MSETIMPLPGESWEAFQKRKKGLKNQKKVNVKSETKKLLENQQLQAIYEKIQNNTPLTHQDSVMVANHIPNVPGFEHLQPDADQKSKTRLRFDKLVSDYKSGTLTDFDKYELANSKLYDWTSDPLNLKSDKALINHPKNPDFIYKEEENEKTEKKNKAEEKHRQAIEKLKNKRVTLDNKIKTLYDSKISNIESELEQIEGGLGWSAELPNFYDINFTNTGEISVKFNQTTNYNFERALNSKKFSDEEKERQRDIFYGSVDIIKKKIGELNKGFIEYNTLKKELNQVNSDLIKEGVFN